MYVNHQHNMIYLAHPKTASQATSNLLEKHYGFEREGRGHHSGIPAGFNAEGYSVATTVRYHLDALVSWWFHLHQKQPIGQPLVETIVKSKYFPRKREMWGLHRHQADVILRFEGLENNLAKWLASHGFEPPMEPLPEKGVTAQRWDLHYRLFIDWETARYIDSRFGEEMAELDYRPAEEDMKRKVKMKGWRRG
jgi:hypothetical protein